jgi:hypothetical protein
MAAYDNQNSPPLQPPNKFLSVFTDSQERYTFLLWSANKGTRAKKEETKMNLLSYSYALSVEAVVGVHGTSISQKSKSKF